MKIYHKADKIKENGEVSALCFTTPHMIPNTEMWTIRDEAVNCRKCLAILAGKTTYRAEDYSNSQVNSGSDLLQSMTFSATTDEHTSLDHIEGAGGTFGGGGASGSWEANEPDHGTDSDNSSDGGSD
jgi:uncharacterized membrane protein YgcG